MNALERRWTSLTETLVRVGAIARFLLRLVVNVPRSLSRFDLIVAQIYNAGALSLVIVMLSGLFVGMVLGLQLFQLLRRFGSEEALDKVGSAGRPLLFVDVRIVALDGVDLAVARGGVLIAGVLLQIPMIAANARRRSAVAQAP